MRPAAPLIAAAGATVLFGASVPAATILARQMSPVLLAALLYLGSGIGLTLMQMIGRPIGLLPPQAPIRRGDWPWLVGAVVAGGMVAPVLLMLGLRHMPATGASLLLNLETLTTLAIAWYGGRESPSRAVVWGAILILAGSLVLSWHGGAGIGWGAVAIAGACLAWGIDNNLTGRLSLADPGQIALVKGLAAGGVNLVIAVSLGAHLPEWRLLLGAGVTGFAGYGLSLVLFILAMRHMGVARASAYFACAPFVGAVLSVLLLGDAVTPWLAVAALLMAAGVWLHVAEAHEHAHYHPPLLHDHAHVHDAHHQHAHDPADSPGEPHVHAHQHAPMTHRHRHFPDQHHRHRHRPANADSAG